jgi:hypothetical protein
VLVGIPHLLFQRSVLGSDWLVPSMDVVIDVYNEAAIRAAEPKPPHSSSRHLLVQDRAFSGILVKVPVPSMPLEIGAQITRGGIARGVLTAKRGIVQAVQLVPLARNQRPTPSSFHCPSPLPWGLGHSGLSGLTRFLRLLGIQERFVAARPSTAPNPFLKFQGGLAVRGGCESVGEVFVDVFLGHGVEQQGCIAYLFSLGSRKSRHHETITDIDAELVATASTIPV